MTPQRAHDLLSIELCPLSTQALTQRLGASAGLSPVSKDGGHAMLFPHARSTSNTYNPNLAQVRPMHNSANRGEHFRRWECTRLCALAIGFADRRHAYEAAEKPLCFSLSPIWAKLHGI